MIALQSRRKALPNILDQIVETKRQELAQRKRQHPIHDLQSAAGNVEPPRDMLAALSQPPQHTVHFITEIKKKSPSAGLIRPDFDPAAIARIYHTHGASAISVLTDEPYFDGRLEYIEQVKQQAPLPVLRKDFMIEPYQIYEARAAGADAILLIGEVLEPAQLADMLDLACELGMTSLIEVHEEKTLVPLLQTIGFPNNKRSLLGINNRNLKLQKTDLSTTEQLAKRIPAGTLLVSESGIKTAADVQNVARAGARAILIGETLMRAPDIGIALDALYPK